MLYQQRTSADQKKELDLLFKLYDEGLRDIANDPRIHENKVKVQVIGESVNYARDLGNHPANFLTPTYLANEAKEISKLKTLKLKL